MFAEHIATQHEEITRELRKHHRNEKEIDNTLLIHEELMLLLDSFVEEDERLNFKNLKIRVTKKWGESIVEISYEGEQFNPINDKSLTIGEMDLNAYGKMILKANKQSISYNYSNITNTISVKAHENSRKELYHICTAIFLGACTGMLLRFTASKETVEFINEHFFHTVGGIFHQSLELLITPLVFLSIVCSLGNMGNIYTLGRIGSRLLLALLFITGVAVIGGIGGGMLVSIGTTPFYDIIEPIKLKTEGFSFAEYILSLFPSNLVSPIADCNLVQMLILSLLVGIALNLVSDKVQGVVRLLNQGNVLIEAMLELVMKILPYVIFCDMAACCEYGMYGFISMGRVLLLQPIMFVTLITALSLMIITYGRISPMPFLRQVKSIMVAPFAKGDAAKAMPTTMRICAERLGVSRSVLSFTLPIGCHMNTAATAFGVIGSSVILLILCGVNFTPQLILIMGITSFFIALAAPSVHHSAIIIMTAVLAAVGAPAYLVGIIIGILPLTDITEKCMNVVCDAGIATAISAADTSLNKDVYNTKQNKDKKK